MEACLLLLIGIPGCGKTYTSELIQQHFHGSQTEVRIICYDEIERVLRETGVSPHSDENERFSAGLEAWRQAREIAITECEDNLRRFLFGVDQPSSKPDTQRRLLLVIDDNMYYRSMRRQYHKLARKYGIAYAQLMLRVPMHICIKNNKGRGRSVPDGVIQRMSTVIQEPDAAVAPWEKYAMIWEPDRDSGLQDTSNMLISLTEMLDAAYKDPVPKWDSEAAQDQKHQSQEETRRNVLHQADLRTRHVVAEIMQNMKTERVGSTSISSACGGTSSRVLGNALTKLRKQFLKELRKKHPFIPDARLNVDQQTKYSDKTPPADQHTQPLEATLNSRHSSPGNDSTSKTLGSYWMDRSWPLSVEEAANVIEDEFRQMIEIHNACAKLGKGSVT